MTGYISYLSEIHTQILELHATRVPTDYRSLLLFLLQPVIWQQKGSVPRSRYHSMAIILPYINDAWGTGMIMQE
jgi:CAS/CSE protein, C-terminus